MTVLPIVGRELLVAARRPWTWWFRVAVAGLALVAAGLMVGLGRSWWSPQQVGEQVFYAVGIATMCFAFAAGPFVTADAISSERREGTLGLLFLTDLRPHNVLLGKLAAASLNTAAGLLATLPLLALPMLIGGVEWQAVGLTALLLVVTLLMSLSVGLAASVLARNGRLALLGSLTVLAIFGGLPFIALALEETMMRHSREAISQWLLLASPAYLAVGAMTGDLPFHGSQAKLWLGIGFQVVLSGAALWLACRRLPMLISEPERSKPERRPRRAARPRTAGQVHPFWRAAGDRATRRFVFRVALGFTGLNLFLQLASTAPGSWDRQILFIFSWPVGYFIHLLVKCQFAAEAADRFHHDRTTGGLEVLLTTPLPVDQILADYWRGLRVRFAASRLLAVVVNAVACVLILTRSVRPSLPDNDAWWLLALLATGTAFVWLDGRALTWAALRAALRARTAGRAMLAATARVLLPGWVAILLWMLWCTNGNSQKSMLHATLLAWMLGFTAWDLWRAWRDRRWLEQNLRASAAGELARRPSWLRAGRTASPVENRNADEEEGRARAAV
jgi:ABC-type transport system involved in multi-copper enzyme maturation permease subunit